MRVTKATRDSRARNVPRVTMATLLSAQVHVYVKASLQYTLIYIYVSFVKAGSLYDVTQRSVRWNILGLYSSITNVTH